MPRFHVIRAEQVGEEFNITFQDTRNGEQYITVARNLGKPALRQAIQDFFRAKRQGGGLIPSMPPAVPGAEQEVDVPGV